MNELDQFVRAMPKAELHVHLEGSVRPATLLTLARRHSVSLPAEDVDGLRRWYTFQDFDHFVRIYMTISSCLRTVEDIELITREFLIGQADQNIFYSEVTFTPYNQYINCQLGLDEQLDAVNRARAWGERELGTRMGIIVDIPRERHPSVGREVAEFVARRHGDGVIAIGLGGPERGNPPEKFREAFAYIRGAGIPSILHAGETEGPSSIWSAIEVGNTRRIGHGVRSIEDNALIEFLKMRQIPLEVCPASNICLRVYESEEDHPLPQLVQHGLRITINSDDPPLFNTTLTDEYLRAQRMCKWDMKTLQKTVLNAVDASLLPEPDRLAMRGRFVSRFRQLLPQEEA